LLEGTKNTFVIDCELLDTSMLVANIFYKLVQIVIYSPSASWIQLLLLLSATCGNGVNCSLQKALEYTLFGSVL